MSKRWWWLAFTDDTRPKGHRALGAAIIEAHIVETAIAVARGIAPEGGNVAILHALVPEDWGHPPLGFATRLLGIAEAEALAMRWNPDRAGLATPTDISQAFLDDDAKPGEPLFRRPAGRKK